MDIRVSSEKVDRYLLSGIKPHGWWPYQSGRGPSMEATAWCAFVLSRQQHDPAGRLVDAAEALNKAEAFLLKNQNKDGGWSTAPDTGFSDWVTGPVLMTLRELKLRRFGEDALKSKSTTKSKSAAKNIKAAVKKGLLHLADSRPAFYPVVGRLLLLLSKGPEGVQFARGWPWDPDCFHWVEPTSYHLFALQVPGLPREEVFQEIIKHANKYILNRVCKGGGWNYGNRETLGAFLTPFRVTTAEALLALQNVGSHTAIQESLDHLLSYKEDDSSVLGLAWTIICLDAYKKDYDQELSFLLKRQKEDGSFSENNVANALASLALKAAQGNNHLKFAN